ncbi:hypothetical protein L1987_32912 [Smallanthus sonchifolius]|uniref:Uncharacterized protein n=1 Tax=Smallanthus sonchifolius TaxID=185202 RepID=A0ACB9HQY2_9ASTR|nr:hypothetical protein L1987_32912 [Smallanthus sonchifolius]
MKFVTPELLPTVSYQSIIVQDITTLPTPAFITWNTKEIQSSMPLKRLTKKEVKPKKAKQKLSAATKSTVDKLKSSAAKSAADKAKPSAARVSTTDKAKSKAKPSAAKNVAT